VKNESKVQEEDGVQNPRSVGCVGRTRQVPQKEIGRQGVKRPLRTVGTEAKDPRSG
jgi:hypothetical protein